MAWLYWRTNGSLLLVMLMHAAVNNTNIVPSAALGATNPLALSTSLVAWLAATLLWIGAVYFLVRMRRADPIVLTVLPILESRKYSQSSTGGFGDARAPLKRWRNWKCHA